MQLKLCGEIKAYVTVRSNLACFAAVGSKRSPRRNASILHHARGSKSISKLR